MAYNSAFLYGCNNFKLVDDNVSIHGSVSSDAMPVIHNGDTSASDFSDASVSSDCSFATTFLPP